MSHEVAYSVPDWLRFDLEDCSALLVERRPEFVEVVRQAVHRVGLPTSFQYLPEASSSVWLIPRIGAVFSAVDSDVFFSEMKVKLLESEFAVLPQKVVDFMSCKFDVATFDQFFVLKVRDYVSDATSDVYEIAARHSGKKI